MARKGMKAMALALAAGSLSASGAASEPALLTEPVQGASLSSEIAPQILDLQYERFRRLTVPVTIDGQGPFRFMIDTGAQATVLSRALADRLGLVERRSALLVGIASSAPVETVHLRALSLGRRTQAVPQVPLVEGEHIGDADGILGIDMLQDQRVLLDFGDRRITLADLEPQTTDRFEIIVRAHERLGQLIVSRALVDGIRTTVLIDTGAQGSIGNPALGRSAAPAPFPGQGQHDGCARPGADGRGEDRGAIAARQCAAAQFPDRLRGFADLSHARPVRPAGPDPGDERIAPVPPGGDRLPGKADHARPAA